VTTFIKKKPEYYLNKKTKKIVAVIGESKRGFLSRVKILYPTGSIRWASYFSFHRDHIPNPNTSELEFQTQHPTPIHFKEGLPSHPGTYLVSFPRSKDPNPKFLEVFLHKDQLAFQKKEEILPLSTLSKKKALTCPIKILTGKRKTTKS